MICWGCRALQSILLSCRMSVKVKYHLESTHGIGRRPASMQVAASRYREGALPKLCWSSSLPAFIRPCRIVQTPFLNMATFALSETPSFHRHNPSSCTKRIATPSALRGRYHRLCRAPCGRSPKVLACSQAKSRSPNVAVHDQLLGQSTAKLA